MVFDWIPYHCYPDASNIITIKYIWNTKSPPEKNWIYFLFTNYISRNWCIEEFIFRLLSKIAWYYLPCSNVTVTSFKARGNLQVEEVIIKKPLRVETGLFGLGQNRVPTIQHQQNREHSGPVLRPSLHAQEAHLDASQGFRRVDWTLRAIIH